MDFRILGQMEAVRSGEALSLGSFKQRSLLALLLLRRDRVVSTDRIIDELWGDDVGSDRQNALWVHISNLRSALEPERDKGSEGTVILTRAPGYVIRSEACDVDADHFERLLAEGRSLLNTDPAAAALVLGEALSLWRGHPLEEFTYETFAQAEIARLGELRLETVEARIDADLARGLARELVGELEGLVREHPTRERLAGQLMLALYRSGRQADALRTYQLVTAGLAENLGLEPSDDLRRLEGQIVVSDPALSPEGATRLPGDQADAGLSIRGYEVREQIGVGTFGITYRGFQPAVGREVAIKVIRPEVADDPAFVRSFEEEAQLVARLEHPHVVPLYDYWREPGAAYLVMRLIGAGSLADRLEDGPLNAEATARLVEHIGGALHHAHSNGVIHGDVRAANVLIDDSGNAYLADFGIAAGASVVADRFSGSPLPSGDALTPATDIAGLARVTAQALAGRAGRLTEIRVGLDPAVAQVLGDGVEADGPFVDVLGFTHTLLAALQATPDVRAPATLDIANPYKGLRPFEQADAADFFGRDRLIDRLIARLGRPGRSGRFVAVVGPSGCGKSSLVKAGLLPAIRRDAAPTSGDWYQIEMTPGSHPFEELETALMGVSVDSPASLLDQLAGEDGIRRTVSHVLPDDHSQLLIVVDQLEELFTMAAPDTAARFLDSIASAVTTEPSRIRVVTTLRADFYDRPLRHRAFGELLREGTEIVTPMSPAELEQTITEPARPLGVTFDPGLVAEMVTEVSEHPAALPLLQYALTEVFDRRRGARVGLADYEQIGGVSGALGERAEGLYLVLDERGRVAARQVFLRLVTVGETGNDTRRRVLLRELKELRDCGDAVPVVIDGFGRHRLLSFDRDPVTRSPTVEVSHEALLHGWTRLDGWIEDTRSEIRDQRKISEATAEWIAAGREDAYLLRGPQLDRLEASIAAASLSLSADEAAFMHDCVSERGRVDAEETARERQKETAEQRSRARTRMLAVTAVFAAIVAILAVFALYQRQQAKDAEQRATTIADGMRLVGLASGIDDPELAMLLALAATEVLAIPGEEIALQAEEAMHLAAQKARLTYPVVDGPIGGVAGQTGVSGVYILPIAELAEHLRANIDRTFTAEECSAFGIPGPCPPPAGGLATPAGTEGPAFDLSSVSPAIPSNVAGGSKGQVVVIGPWDDESGPLSEFDAYAADAGVAVSYTWQDGPPVSAIEMTQAGNPPDVVLVPQPGAIANLEEQIGVIDLGSYIDRDVLVADLGEYAMSQGTMADDGTWPAEAGRILGIPIKADIKGLVWYPRDAFAAAGYTIPETWDELISLSDQIVADGGTPWCTGWDSGPASGWPGTDWIEGLMLRTGSLEDYDRWVAHEIPFDHPGAMDAAEALDQIIMTPGYVLNGPESIQNTHFGMRIGPMTWENGPGCWLAYGASFMTNFLPVDVDTDTAVGIFPLPPMEVRGPAPLLSGGVYAVVLTDRPEVRDFVRWLASPEFGRIWAAKEDGEFLSGNIRFDLDNYGEGEEIRRELARIVVEAWQTSNWRFDGSDLMPPAIGAFSGHLQRGPFWQGMLDYANGKRTIEQVMHDIEADWVALEAGASDESGSP